MKKGGSAAGDIGGGVAAAKYISVLQSGYVREDYELEPELF